MSFHRKTLLTAWFKFITHYYAHKYTWFVLTYNHGVWTEMHPNHYQDYWDHHGWWWWWWWYLTITEHYNYTSSLNSHTNPIRQILLHHHLKEKGIKVLECDNFPQFAHLICGRAQILVPKALTIMIFQLPSGWFSRLLSFQNLYDDRQREHLLLALWKTNVTFGAKKS